MPPWSGSSSAPSSSLKTQASVTSTNHTPALTALSCSPFVLPLPHAPPTYPPHVHTLDDCRGFSAESYWYDTVEVQAQEQIGRRGVFPLPHDRRTAVVSSYAAAPGRYCGLRHLLPSKKTTFICHAFFYPRRPAMDLVAQASTTPIHPQHRAPPSVVVTRASVS